MQLFGMFSDDAVKTGPYYYGSGDQTLDVYRYKGMKDMLSYVITATTHDCTPVEEVVTGTINGGMLHSLCNIEHEIK